MLFILLYFDAGNPTFAQIWKMPIFVYCLWYIFTHHIKQKAPTHLKWGYWWGIKNFFNFGIVNYAVQNVTSCVKFTILPVLIDFLRKTFKDKEKLFNTSLIFSQYVILSSIPFLLGFLESPGKALEYDDVKSFSGIFSVQHTCSIITSMASVFVLFTLFNYKKYTLKWFYNLFLYILAAIVVYKAFTRTGWAMFGIGTILVYFYQKQTFVKKVLTFLVSLIFLVIIYNSFVVGNERLDNRLNDRSNGYQQSAGSGRNTFRRVSLKYWEEGNIAEQLIGYGIDPLKDNMMKKIGARLYSHNGFVDALVANGIIGIILLSGFCLTSLAFALKRRKHKYAPISISCIIMYIAFQLIQGGTFTFQDFLMAAAIVLIYENKQSCSKQVKC